MKDERKFKYTILVDQRSCLDLGIYNINQAVIFDLLVSAPSWADAVVNDDDNDVYFWVSRNAICMQLPILGLKPDTVWRHFKSLDKIGLINYIKKGKKDLIKITKKGKKYSFGSIKTDSETNPEILGNSETNPKILGNKSETDSETNPTYKTTNQHKTIIINCFEYLWKNQPWQKDGKAPSLKKFTEICNKLSTDDDVKKFSKRIHKDWWIKHEFVNGRKGWKQKMLTYLKEECWEDEMPQVFGNEEVTKKIPRIVEEPKQTLNLIDEFSFEEKEI